VGSGSEATTAAGAATAAAAASPAGIGESTGAAQSSSAGGSGIRVSADGSLAGAAAEREKRERERGVVRTADGSSFPASARLGSVRLGSVRRDGDGRDELHETRCEPGRAGKLRTWTDRSLSLVSRGASSRLTPLPPHSLRSLPLAHARARARAAARRHARAHDRFPFEHTRSFHSCCYSVVRTALRRISGSTKVTTRKTRTNEEGGWREEKELIGRRKRAARGRGRWRKEERGGREEKRSGQYGECRTIGIVLRSRRR
jgi:hypothetical protein